jgi:hypothetical protein
MAPQLQHKSITNDPTNALLRGLHSPGFIVANATARLAITTAQNGDLCFQLDTGLYYSYNGGVWTNVSTPPSFSGLTANGTTLTWQNTGNTASLEVDNTSPHLTTTAHFAMTTQSFTLTAAAAGELALDNAGNAVLTGSGNISISPGGNVTIGGGGTVTLSCTGGVIIEGGLVSIPNNKIYLGGSIYLNTHTWSDIPSSGNLDTAVNSVDSLCSGQLAQTTDEQTITLPSPTVTTAGRIFYLGNNGSATFSFYGKSVAAGSFAMVMWNGISWCPSV